MSLTNHDGVTVRCGGVLRLALVLLTAAVVGSGCASQPKPQPRPPRNIPGEVTAALNRSAAAWNAGNLDAFLGIYANDATFALADTFLQGRMAIREYYAPLFEPDATRDSLSFEQLQVEVLSPDVALVRAIYQNTRRGQIVRRGASTLAVRRELDSWRIIHDQTN
jgi:uncharacterized protein (TIGR02246 family)